MARTRTSHWSRALAAQVLLTLTFGGATARLAVAETHSGFPQAKGVPRLVYVESLAPPPRGARAGETSFDPPAHAKRALFVREPTGAVHPLLTGLRFHDVAHPVPSWNAKTIVFAGQVAADSAWRIWTVGADGHGLTQVTRSDGALDVTPLGLPGFERFVRYDDTDPTWLPDGRIVFVSTRFPQIAQRGFGLVTNLFVVRADGTGLERITTERNGAAKPAIDPVTGRVVYARWFFNPYLASDSTATGLTVDPQLALPHDRVDLWQAVSIYPDGDRIQLAAGDPRSHDSLACFSPCPLPDGSVVGVRAAAPMAPPDHGGDELVRYEGGAGAGRLLVASPTGFPRASASDPMIVRALRLNVEHPDLVQCPTALPDGRIAFAFDTESVRPRDLGLYCISSRGGRIARILDDPQVDETDPFPLVPRKVPPILPAQGGIDDPATLLPATTLAQVQRMEDTFRFDCLNVFASGPVDSPTPSAPRLTRNVRIRFWATLARPDAATGDTVVLVRESKVSAAGGVHESDMPGDVSMFEQLVDSLGHTLMSAHGPAFVPGSNFARVEAGTKCIGCHAGHSTLTVPKNYSDARWFNASPSAVVTASSVRKGAAPAEALVDRVAKGPIERVGWVADGPGPQSARLEWSTPIEAKTFVLYAPWADAHARTDVRVRACTLVFTLHGKEVGRAEAKDVRAAGTRVEIPPLVLDGVEVRPVASGNVGGRPAVALAEIETIARLPE